MTTLKVSRLPDKDYAYENVLYHNKDDFKGLEKLHIKVNNAVIYYSNHANVVSKGSICVNEIVRNKLQIKLDDSIPITKIFPKQTPLSTINIQMVLNAKGKTIISCHEDEITEKILKNFQNFYFHDGQTLLLLHNDKNLILNIINSGEGFITKKTIINISTVDPTLNLISAKLLKRDLFCDNYNFESIGIGGLDNELIGVFRRALATRAIKPSIIEKLGIKHVKGILLYGPPGTGKTLIARRIGSMITDKEPKVVNGPEIINKFYGQSEENIRKLFEEAKTDYDLNKENAGLYVIIFDEIDALCKTRGGGSNSSLNDSILNQLLTMIDGVNQFNNFFIIGMTNRKDLLDEALLRSGRIEIHVEIKLPDVNGRKQIFNIHTNKMQTNNMIDKDVDINILAQMTENYSGADIETIVRNAGTMAIHEKLASNQQEITDTDISITMKHLLLSLSEVLPLFGNTNKLIKDLIPINYKHLSETIETCYMEISNIIKKKNQNLKTILIFGENKTGKTTLVAKLAADNNVKYTKLIRAIDMIGMDETSKSYRIGDIVTSSYVSEDSLIIFDDIEIFMNYLLIGNKAALSNKIYQTLITLLKTEPLKKDHMLTLIMTCGDYDCFGLIKKFFNVAFNLRIN